MAGIENAGGSPGCWRSRSRPTIYLFAYGQLTAVPLVGVAGFLACLKKKQYFWAGVFGGLTASKPHLFSLFALGILFEAVRTKEGRTVLFGGLCLGAVTTLLVSLPNWHVWSDYLAAAGGTGSEIHRSLGEWKPPLIGWYLRQIVPGQPFAVQFVPLVIAAVGFVIVWWKNRSRWDWLESDAVGGRSIAPRRPVRGVGARRRLAACADPRWWRPGSIPGRTGRDLA